MPERIEILDTTLRDGEQTSDVSFSGQEKLSIAKTLLLDVKADRIEVASVILSKEEKESVKRIGDWAMKNGLQARVEVLGFVDFGKTVQWLSDCNIKVLNLLAKGSRRHCETQLGKTLEQHAEDVRQNIALAKAKGLTVNLFLEDWSNGMRHSKDFVFGMVERLKGAGVKRFFLPDTLGNLSPPETAAFVKEMVERFPWAEFEFHAHNDYGLATANSLAACQAGAKAVHVTVNGLGERAGNAPLDEVVVALKDKGGFSVGVDETQMFNASKIIEAFSGKRVSQNKPISGDNVFTQTAGIHADGDKKGKLYENELMPQRFGRQREYALGKLTGKASIEMNLRRLGMELSEEQVKAVRNKVVELGEKKEKVTTADLPFIVSDAIANGSNAKAVSIEKCVSKSGLGVRPSAEVRLKVFGRKFEEKGEGNGGYDAFMNALKKISKKAGFRLPELLDYEVRIPPGGKTDAIVEATITWKSGKSNVFKTIGVDSDQLMAAVKATEKMLNMAAKRPKK
ncbi:MAG: 2-isopropylmalate synthase [Candidatus Diapherotrites archaeon]|nr:2-isopropylmalate synthase [Candidatus Diapherotrites archaeon]